MRNNPNRPYELGWERLNPESQALAEGLRRLKAQLMPVNPRIAEEVKVEAFLITRRVSGKTTILF